MEQPKLTPEQRQENMHIMDELIDSGDLTIDTLQHMSPADTTIEHYQAVKAKLREQHRANGGHVLRVMSGL